MQHGTIGPHVQTKKGIVHRDSGILLLYPNVGEAVVFGHVGVGNTHVGNVFARHAFVGGPRQNQLRSLDVGASANERLVGGLQNGPGTHTGDADPSLITADGLVRTFTLLDGAARRTGGLDGTTDRSYD